MFGRRRQPVAEPPTTAQWAYLSAAPVVPRPPADAAHVGGAAGWAPMPTPSTSQQIGMFGGSPLNQFPVNLPGVQLHGGREGNNPGWYYPAVVPLANGSVQQTQRPAQTPGAQRYGSIFSGPLGPLAARSVQQRVLAAQVRQSGLAVMNWARSLTPGNEPLLPTEGS